jgi:ribosomal protein L31E
LVKIPQLKIIKKYVFTGEKQFFQADEVIIDPELNSLTYFFYLKMNTKVVIKINFCSW